MQQRILALLLCGVLLLGVLAGCGKKNDTGDTSGDKTVNGTETKNYGEFKRRALVQADRLRDVEGMHPFDLRREIGQRPEALRPVKSKAVGAKVTYNKAYNKSYPAG